MILYTFVSIQTPTQITPVISEYITHSPIMLFEICQPLCESEHMAFLILQDFVKLTTELYSLIPWYKK